MGPVLFHFQHSLERHERPVRDLGIDFDRVHRRPRRVTPRQATPDRLKRAIISDIHSNLEGLEAVLARYRPEECR